jgi:hypothetical protein
MSANANRKAVSSKMIDRGGANSKKVYFLLSVVTFLLLSQTLTYKPNNFNTTYSVWESIMFATMFAMSPPSSHTLHHPKQICSATDKNRIKYNGEEFSVRTRPLHEKKQK